MLIRHRRPEKVLVLALWSHRARWFFLACHKSDRWLEPNQKAYDLFQLHIIEGQNKVCTRIFWTTHQYITLLVAAPMTSPCDVQRFQFWRFWLACKSNGHTDSPGYSSVIWYVLQGIVYDYVQVVLQDTGLCGLDNIFDWGTKETWPLAVQRAFGRKSTSTWVALTWRRWTHFPSPILFAKSWWKR